MEKIRPDAHQITMRIAKNYYQLLEKKKAAGYNDFTNLAGVSLKDWWNDFKIKAIEQSWAAMVDETEREFIKKNLFEGIPMQCINLPMSMSAMKRARRKFLTLLAKKIGEM